MPAVAEIPGLEAVGIDDRRGADASGLGGHADRREPRHPGLREPAAAGPRRPHGVHAPGSARLSHRVLVPWRRRSGGHGWHSRFHEDGRVPARSRQRRARRGRECLARGADGPLEGSAPSSVRRRPLRPGRDPVGATRPPAARLHLRRRADESRMPVELRLLQRLGIQRTTPSPPPRRRRDPRTAVDPRAPGVVRGRQPDRDPARAPRPRQGAVPRDDRGEGPEGVDLPGHDQPRGRRRAARSGARGRLLRCVHRVRVALRRGAGRGRQAIQHPERRRSARQRRPDPPPRHFRGGFVHHGARLRRSRHRGPHRRGRDRLRHRPPERPLLDAVAGDAPVAAHGVRGTHRRQPLPRRLGALHARHPGGPVPASVVEPAALRDECFLAPLLLRPRDPGPCLEEPAPTPEAACHARQQPVLSAQLRDRRSNPRHPRPVPRRVARLHRPGRERWRVPRPRTN